MPTSAKEQELKQKNKYSLAELASNSIRKLFINLSIEQEKLSLFEAIMESTFEEAFAHFLVKFLKIEHRTEKAVPERLKVITSSSILKFSTNATWKITEKHALTTGIPLGNCSLILHSNGKSCCLRQLINKLELRNSARQSAAQ